MRDLVCISHLRWDFVWQRPQHLLSRLAQRYRILFVEEPIDSTEATVPHLNIYKHEPTGVTVLRLIQPVEHMSWHGHGDPLTHPTYSKLLREYLAAENYNDPNLWLYTPMASEFTQTVNHRLLIYDVMDELSAFKGAPGELKVREEDLLRRADIVFTGGVSLYRSKLSYNPHTHLFPSGVEVGHFAKAQRKEFVVKPDDLNGIPGPILGYFGVIDERMDLALLARVAEARPDWHIVLLGPVAKIGWHELPQAPNIHYLGMKDYKQLPNYLAFFDVALVPFAITEATRFLSPTKTLEYMAAHKPIVSTAINDVVELYGEVVRIGRTPEEFAAHVATALQESYSERVARWHREDLFLAQHTWDSIAQRMGNIIETTEQPKRARVATYEGRRPAPTVRQ